MKAHSGKHQKLSVSGGIYCNGIHLYMLWPSPGVVLLLWGKICQQLHEAQAYLFHKIVSILMFMFTLPNRTRIHYLRPFFFSSPKNVLCR